MNKTSKILLIIVFILFVLLFSILFYCISNTYKTTKEINTSENIEINVNIIYDNNKDNVDNGINELMNISGFDNLNKKNQMLKALELLMIYQDNQIIKGLSYSYSNLGISFEYNNGSLKGAQGGVSFKEFDSEFN